MRRYKHLTDVQKLMWMPERIRNIGIVAHVDHGKCVSPRTRIAMVDRMITAEELFERYKGRGEIEVQAPDETRVDVSGLNLRVNSFDKKSGKIVEGRITKMWKLKKSDSLVRVTVETGACLETTPEHKFLVLAPDGSFEFVRASELKEGMSVVAARKLIHPPDGDVKEFFLTKLSGDHGFCCQVSKEFNAKIRAVGWNHLYRISGTELKESSFRFNIRKGRYRLRDISTICKKIGVDQAELYDNISSLNYRGWKQLGKHSSLSVRLPGDLSPLYYLAGLAAGDGNLSGSITSDNPEVHGRVRVEAAKLGQKPAVRRFKNGTPRMEMGKTLIRIFQLLFDYPKSKKSENIGVSEFLSASKLEDISSFIRGYMDADGTVEKWRSAISVCSKSVEMLRGLQLLLLKFDVASKLDENKRTLYISGRSSLENYLSKIGFSVRCKRKRAEELFNKSRASKLDRVPLSGEVLKEIRHGLSIPQNQIGSGYSRYENSRTGLSKTSLKDVLMKFEEAGGRSTAKMEELNAITSFDTTFTFVKKVERVKDVEHVYDFTVEKYSNFVAEGIVVHNTTLTDSLVAASGIISSELAGEQLFTDFLDIEQQRGITVQTAAVSLAHTLEGKEYMINLLDTPGHVDFSGDVTRALRAIDGVVVVMDAVEGVMPQTETVLRQALQERARPVLFINKVDRLIDELKLTPDGIQARFIKLITKFNELIRRYAHSSVAEKWQVNVEEGSVAFGSAKEKWALSVPQMKKKGISFRNIIEAYQASTQVELAKKSPLYEVILDMVIRHLPNPKEAQAVRIPVIWKGDLNSELGRGMLTANPDGKICMVITDIVVDEQAGVISTGRIFCGTLEKGKSVKLTGVGQEARIQQVNVYMGPDRVMVDKVPAGNIGAVVGLKEALVGETLVETGVEGKGFEELRYISEPVVTVAVEPKNFQELPKLVNELKRISREDPNVHVKINEETGEYLVSGMGEVHLEIVQYKLKEAGLEVKTSEPIVVYREAVIGKAGPVEGKSPNRHNRFMVSVEPLEPEVIRAIGDGKVTEKQDRKERANVLRGHGWETHAARNVVSIIGPNILVDVSKGVQYMREVEDYVVEAFREVVEEGPIMREPMRGLKVLVEDATLHEDSVHRGPAQIVPAVRRPIQAAILLANPTVLEPLLKLEVRVPQEFMGGATKVIQGRRGRILNMEAEEDITIIKASLPVANSFGLAAELRSETEGRAIWATEFDKFEQLPGELQEQVIRDTRKRKGLKPEPPRPDEFMEK